MKKVLLSAVAAFALSAGAALAADLPVKAKPIAAPPPPSPWDIAFGASPRERLHLARHHAVGPQSFGHGVHRGALQHQSDVAALRRYRRQQHQLPDSRAAGEFDIFGGVRPTFGPLALDFGVTSTTGTRAASAISPAGGGLPGCLAAPARKLCCEEELELLGSLQQGHLERLTTSGRWATRSSGTSTTFLNTGANGTYLSGSAKYTPAPSSMALWGSVGWFISGEVGHQWLGTSDAFYGLYRHRGQSPFQFGTPYTDYLTWNVGVAFTWKVFTLDLRYYDTDLSKGDCAGLH